MVPEQIWRATPSDKTAPLAAAPRLLLVLLWDYSGWSPRSGDTTAFCWPGIEALAQRLGASRASVFRNLSTLIREGWISKGTRRITGAKGGSCERRGWWLHLEPVGADRRDDVPDGDNDQGQLVIGWSDGDDTRVSGVRLPESQECDSPSLRSATPQSHSRDSASSTCLNPHEPPPDPPAREPSRDPNAARAAEQHRGRGGEGSGSEREEQRARVMFDRYEIERRQLIGGQPIRACTPRILADILALVDHAARTYDLSREQGWATVEKYGSTALRMAADAKRTDSGQWGQHLAAACRQDGKEWTAARFDSVMARSDERPPQRGDVRLVDGVDPHVDGIEVSGASEWDAWATGGEEAVRAWRTANPRGKVCGTAMVSDFLDRLRQDTRDKQRQLDEAREETERMRATYGDP